MRSVSLSRRGFLRGRAQPAALPVRPPWALDEPVFAQRCTRCNACPDACGQGIVVRGDGGYPELDFARGGCTFCGKCVAACSAGALQPDAEATGALPWRARIGGGCLTLQPVVCRSCGDICAERAIRFRLVPGAAAQPQVDMQACTGCGACVAACPARAIDMTAAVAAQEAR